MNEIIEILKKLHPDVDFETRERLVDDRVLDSFDIISLVSKLNETFDIKIKATDLRPENFNSAKAIFEMVNRMLDE